MLWQESGLLHSLSDMVATEILNTYKTFLASDLVLERDHMVAQLEECRLVEDKEIFVDRVFSAAKPVFYLRDNNPAEYQKLKREINKTVGVNEVLGYNRGLYDMGEENLYIHLDPVREGEVSLAQFHDGLRLLAEIVAEDESVEVINADSWIVAKNPGLVKRLGFTLGETLTDEERERYFPGVKVPVRKSSIAREEFLKKYLKND